MTSSVPYSSVPQSSVPSSSAPSSSVPSLTAAPLVHPSNANIVPVATQHEIAQADYNCDLASIEHASTARKRKRARQRLPPTAHRRRCEWLHCAPRRAYDLSLEHHEYKLDKLTSEMSFILSGSQGGRPCAVTRSTVHSWLQSQRKRGAEHARIVTDGDDELETDDGMTDCKD